VLLVVWLTGKPLSIAKIVKESRGVLANKSAELQIEPSPLISVPIIPETIEKSPIANSRLGLSVEPNVTPVYSRHEFSGLKGRILTAYKNSYSVTQRAGVALTSQITYREYLAEVIHLLPACNKELSGLTSLVELVVYSDHEPDESMAALAEKLASDIKSK